MSKKDFQPAQLDIAAFAREGGTLTGSTPAGHLTRLAQSLHTEPDGLSDANRVDWQAQGHAKMLRGGAFETWMNLQASATVPLTCQLCLTAVPTALTVDRPFRFVPDEATAAQLDEQADEDVLVSRKDFDLIELIEDELLLALPLVPQHDICPVQLQRPEAPEFAQPDEEPAPDAAPAQPHPFAALQGLVPRKRGHESH